ILTIYRPPSSSKKLFSTEFPTLLENLISTPSELIITGDFNFHVDNINCAYATSFLTLLETFGLSQLVSFPTHDSCHTLDLLITRLTSNILTDVTFTYPALYDHSAILYVFSVPLCSRSPRIT